MATERLGPYLIQERIGAGGMGEVYRALHEPLQRTVALKLLRIWNEATDDELKRFQREIKIACSLVHPALVRVLDGDTAGGVHYLAMELLVGQPLDARIRSDGPMDAMQVRAIGAQMASGLAHLHAQGIIHRDVKPANVFLCRDGQAKLLDFGLAKRHDATQLTSPGTLLGTVHFMAPEMLREGAQASASTDLWALGGMLYLMLTGAAHVRADGVAELMAAIMAQEIVPPSRLVSGVPEELDTLVMLLLERDPASRLSDAGELASALAGAPATPIAATRLPRHARAQEKHGALDPAAPTARLGPLHDPSEVQRRRRSTLLVLLVVGLGTAALAAALRRAGREPEVAAPAARLASVHASPRALHWIFDRSKGSKASISPDSPGAAFARSLGRWLEEPSGALPDAGADSKPEAEVEQRAFQAWSRSVTRSPVPTDVAVAALDVVRAWPSAPEGWLALGRVLELDGFPPARVAYARGMALLQLAGLRKAPRFVWSALASALISIPGRSLEQDLWTWAGPAEEPRAVCAGLRDALETRELERLEALLDKALDHARLAETAAILRGHIALEVRREPARARALWHRALARVPARHHIARVLVDHLMARGLLSQARTVAVQHDPRGWRRTALEMLSAARPKLDASPGRELVELAVFLALARADLKAAEALWPERPPGPVPQLALELLGAGSRLSWLEPAVRQLLFTDAPDAGTWTFAAGALATPAGASLMRRYLEQADARWGRSPIPALARALWAARAGDDPAAAAALAVARERSLDLAALVPAQTELDARIRWKHVEARSAGRTRKLADVTEAADRFDLQPDQPIWALLEVNALTSPADGIAQRAAIERLRISVTFRRGGLWVLRALPQTP